jgi:small subunit ribosomal protein S15
VVNLARIYSRKKGKHGSKKPPVRIVHKWQRFKKKEVENMVIDLAKEKYSTAMIGTILRDRNGIPDIKAITGKTVSVIARENNLYPNLPEDLMNLFKKTVLLREHIGRMRRKDKSSIKGLEHIESKIRRLIKYYSREGVIPADFRYDPEKIKLIVQK